MKRAYRGDLWPGLEEALVIEVQRARDADPLRPIDLLVGSNLLGLHLRRLLARRFGAIAAVRPLTFLDLARRRAESSLLASGSRPLPRLGEELLVAKAIQGLAPGSYFEPVRSFPGFRISLHASIRDLKDAGWKPRDLRDAVDRARLGREARARIVQLLDAFEGYEHGLRASSFYDRSDLLQHAVARADRFTVPRSIPEADHTDRPTRQDPAQLSLFEDAAGSRSHRGDRGRAEAPELDAHGPQGEGASRAVGDFPLLFVYGFYDLLEVQWRLLRAESRLRETVVFVPSGEGSPLAFARPFLERLVQEGFDVHESASKGIERRLVPEAMVLSAPGESRQAAEVARQVISWAGEGIRFGDMAVLARVAEPTLTEVSRALDRAGVPHVLSAGRPFAASRAARTALHFLSISSSDWGREEVISFLSVADLRERSRPAERPSVALDRKADVEGSSQEGADSSAEIRAAPPNDSEVAPAEWDLVSAEAGIVKGKDSWSRELRRESARAHAALRELEGDEASGHGADLQDDDAVSGSAIEEARRRLARSRSLEGLIGRLGRALDLWPQSGAWSECAEGFSRGLRSLLRSSDELQELEQVLEGFQTLDPLGPCPDRETFSGLVRRAFEARASHDRRFERDGVLVSTIEAARGLSFRAVAVAGVAEKIFPADVREDPLLLDRDRERFAITSPRLARLPMKRDRFEEERLLFHMATTCSRESLLLTWSRLSQDEDRECLPSPFLREAVGRLGVFLTERDNSARVSGALAEARSDRVDAAPSLPIARRVPLLPLAPPEPDRAIDTSEWLLARAWRETAGGARSRGAGSLQRHAPEPPHRVSNEWELITADEQALLGQLSSRHPFLTRALMCERARHSVRSFGPYDGFLSGDAARKAFERFLSGPVSSTRIDEYAACPFKAFVGRVLKVRALRDPVETISIEPLARGILIHRIMADFLGGLAKESGGRARLSSWPPETLRERLRESARTGFGWAEHRFAVGYPLLWMIEQVRLLEWLTRWLDREIEDAKISSFAPTAFEWAFGFEGDPAGGPAVELALPSGRLVLHGKLDRIDVDVEGHRARVIDYKTSAWPVTDKVLHRRIEEGRATQLPIYLMAAAKLHGNDAPPLDIVSAEYLYLVDGTRASLDARAWSAAKDGFVEALDTLVSSARSGDFTADPRDDRACSFCEFQMPCGRSRTWLFERKKGDPRAAARLALREGDEGA